MKGKHHICYISFPQRMLSGIDAAREAAGLTRAGLVREAVREYLRTHPRQNAEPLDNRVGNQVASDHEDETGPSGDD